MNIIFKFIKFSVCEESTKKNISQKPGRKKTKSKKVQKSVTQLTDKGAKNGMLVSKGRLEWEKN